MSETNERSVASAGSVAVAWLVTLPGRHFSYTTDNYEKAVFCHSEESGSEIIPLYRSPQPTLSDAEREAVGKVLAHYSRVYDEHGASEEDDRTLTAIRGLLERTK